jgi:hypothetical protein
MGSGMTARRLIATGVLLLAGCGGTPRTGAGEPPPTRARETAPPAATAPAPSNELPVAEAVAKLHRSAFDPEANIGEVICIVTLHDAPLERGSFFAVMLLASGTVATWRQTPTAGEEPFFAQLEPDERGRAFELVRALAETRAQARSSFAPTSLVMGVSFRGDKLETLYFDNAQLPDTLSRLVALLKHRLEATNRSP